MTLAKARAILTRPLILGDAEQLKAKAFIDRAYAAADEVMKTVDGEAGSCLLETIIWLVKKRWNDQASMDQYLRGDRGRLGE